MCIKRNRVYILHWRQNKFLCSFIAFHSVWFLPLQLWSFYLFIIFITIVKQNKDKNILNCSLRCQQDYNNIQSNVKKRVKNAYWNERGGAKRGTRLEGNTDQHQMIIPMSNVVLFITIARVYLNMCKSQRIMFSWENYEVPCWWTDKLQTAIRRDKQVNDTLLD